MQISIASIVPCKLDHHHLIQHMKEWVLIEGHHTNKGLFQNMYCRAKIKEGVGVALGGQQL
eukprot:5769939-Ditylum_brightwellii.AAC.1